MKRAVLLSIATSSLLLATNGDTLIGVGVESRAMGGTGIASFNGSENALSNPALLAKSKADREFSFGSTIFDANVKVSTTAGQGTDGKTMPGTGVSRTSEQDISLIPVIAISHRVSPNLVFGLGMYGTAGMGTDFRKDDTPYQKDSKNPQLMNIGLFNIRNNLILMQFAPSIAYKNGNFGLGFTAIMQYGELSIDFDTYDPQNGYVRNHIGDGPSQDYGYGFQVGGYFDVTPSLTIGAVYRSAIDMEYDGQISKASQAFGYGLDPNGLPAKSDHLEQPEEIGVGIAYKYTNVVYTADYRQIKWNEAKGYKDFGWDNQDVIGIGAKYEGGSYWIGIGANFSNNPIPNNGDTTKVTSMGPNTNGDTMNLLNYAMFPAIITEHYSIGGGMKVGKDVSIATAFVYAPEVSEKASARSVGVGDVETKHSQQSLTLSLKYQF
ncbi:MAG TPA: aromatic hydrocarbon degradation protein [Campylobacterales bacterium]|nr:aromatic hydrocarbon degradation protein [Campylobacterales bacterium]